MTSPGFKSKASIVTGLMKVVKHGVSSAVSIYVFVPPLLVVLSFLPGVQGQPSKDDSTASLIADISSIADKTSVVDISSIRDSDLASKGNIWWKSTSNPFGHQETVYRDISIVP